MKSSSLGRLCSHRSSHFSHLSSFTIQEKNGRTNGPTQGRMDQKNNFLNLWARDRKKNKWRGLTISLWTGGQGRPTPIHTPRPIQPPSQHRHIQKASKTLVFPLFDSCLRTNGPTDRRTDGRTESPLKLRVRNLKQENRCNLFLIMFSLLCAPRSAAF